MTDDDENIFTNKERAILLVLYSSQIPLTVYEIRDKSEKEKNVKMAWETCESILRKLEDEDKFVVSKEYPKKKTVRWYMNYEKKRKLKEKYKL